MSSPPTVVASSYSGTEETNTRRDGHAIVVVDQAEASPSTSSTRTSPRRFDPMIHTVMNSPSDEQGPIHHHNHEGYYPFQEATARTAGGGGGDVSYVGFSTTVGTSPRSTTTNSNRPLEQGNDQQPMLHHHPSGSSWLSSPRYITTLIYSYIFFLNTPQQRKTFVQACYLGVAAILGTLVRMVLAQLFGEECRNPGTVGWLADDAVLCVTASGQASVPGGIVFADLPSNLLGSFIMGLMQDGKSLQLAVEAPIAFVPPSNLFQAYDIFHVAIKTGFCGSLTTFSGWNSEMVVMMVGSDVTKELPTQIWKALFGYVVGLETALGSYVFGRTVAWWVHQWRNPELALEQDAMKTCKSHGVAVNHALPILERRYLHHLFEDTSNQHDIGDHDGTNYWSLSPASTLTTDELAPLTRWRESTKAARKVESGRLANALMELETTLLANKEPMNDKLYSIATLNGWDIDSLCEWISRRYHHHYEDTTDSTGGSHHLTSAGVYKTLSEETSVWYTVPVALTILLLSLSVLICCMVYWSNPQTSYEITYRTMAYAMLFSTPGALLRWTLSGWNGTVITSSDWRWLPFGTLTANVLGAMVSISMIGWEYNLQLADVAGFWAVASVRAVKVGFSGCLTTVSTMVSEVHTLTQLRQDRGYKYVLITLSTSCIVAMILFVVIV